MLVNALVLMASLTTAHAETGLLWQWEDGEVRQYLAKGTVIMPQSAPLTVEIPNLPAMPIGRFDSTALMTCTKADVMGKKAILLRCKIDDYQLQVVPFLQEHIVNVEKIMSPITEAMSKSTVQARFSYDGRLSKVELVGLADDLKWMADNQAQAELIIQRTISLLDMQLPRDGDDRGKGRWRQTESQIMQMPIMNSASTASIEHTVSGSGDSLAINSKGKAVVFDQIASDSSSSKAPLQFDCQLVCEAAFDKERGNLTRRECNLQGTATANSIGGQAGHKYEHLGILELTSAK